MEVPGVQSATAVVDTETEPPQDTDQKSARESTAVLRRLHDDDHEGEEEPAEQRGVCHQVVPHLADRPDQ